MYWISGNGNKIDIRSYHILGWPPLESNDNILNLQRWMQNQGIKKLKELVVWGSRGEWTGLKNLQPPPHIHRDYDTLSSLLNGISPLNYRYQDNRG